MNGRPIATRGPASRGGFSLIEVMVGVTMLGAALLGLAAAASVGLQQTTRSRQDSQYWADAQRVIDSVIGAGFRAGNNGASGSTTVNGRTIEWSITGSSAPQKVRVVVWRNGY